jgi:hypothetical protein
MGWLCFVQCPARAWRRATFRWRFALFLRLSWCDILFTGKALFVGAAILPGTPLTPVKISLSGSFFSLSV